MKTLKIKNYPQIVILFSIFIFATSSLHAYEKEKKVPILLLQPAFMHPPICDPIPGAKRTVITAAYLERNSLGVPTTSFLKPSWQTFRKSSMCDFVKRAKKNLSQNLITLHPQFLRDENEVIQTAIIDSANPITASTILSPEFSKQFTPIFGPELLIAIPSANRIYIFSKLASPLENIASAIRDDYKISSYPLSTEIFELGKGRLHAIGSID